MLGGVDSVHVGQVFTHNSFLLYVMKGFVIQSSFPIIMTICGVHVPCGSSK